MSRLALSALHDIKSHTHELELVLIALREHIKAGNLL